MNHASFLGYLAFDPELKQTSSGKTYLKNFIKVRTRKKTPEGKTIYDDIPFTAFGSVAEQIAKYLHRGNPLLLSGTMSSSRYELTVKDPSNGSLSTRNILNVNLIANELEFVPKGTDNSPDSQTYNLLDEGFYM